MTAFTLTTIATAGIATVTVPLMIQTAKRKFGDSKGEDFREKSKIARYLEYRGYPEFMIRDYLFD